jgi:hypothetical protein
MQSLDEWVLQRLARTDEVLLDTNGTETGADLLEGEHVACEH